MKWTGIIGALLVGMLVGKALSLGLPMNMATLVGLIVGETWPVALLTYAYVSNREALTSWVRGL